MICRESILTGFQIPLLFREEGYCCPKYEHVNFLRKTKRPPRARGTIPVLAILRTNAITYLVKIRIDTINDMRHKNFLLITIKEIFLTIIVFRIVTILFVFHIQFEMTIFPNFINSEFDSAFDFTFESCLKRMFIFDFRESKDNRRRRENPGKLAYISI